MRTNEAAMKTVAARLANDSQAGRLFSRFDSSANAVSARVPMMGSNVTVRSVANEDGRFTVGLTGLSSGSLRWLHDFLVIDTIITFTSDGKEIHAIGMDVEYQDLVDMMVQAAHLVLSFRSQEEYGHYSHTTTVNTYWSSGTLNFGDWIGPHLLNHMTGRQPIQGNRQGNSTRILYTVGSVAGWFKRNNVDVWGSGLIKPFTQDEILIRKQLKGVKIHAVRGKLTQQHLVESIGWDVPDIYGDPALLMPDMIQKASTKTHNISLVPHYVHRAPVLAGGVGLSDCKVIDVRQDIRNVIPEISSGNVVVSSSLHGLITAQAYGVPWVWLDVEDQQLTGKDFKFKDFFSCLEGNDIARVSVSKNDLGTLPLEEIAKHASLPSLNIDLDKLRNSLPVSGASTPRTQSQLH